MPLHERVSSVPLAAPIGLPSTYVAGSPLSNRREMTRARRVQGAAGSHPVARPQVEMDVQKQPSSNDAPSSGNLGSPSPDPIGPPDNVDPVPGPWSHRSPGRDPLRALLDGPDERAPRRCDRSGRRM